MRDFRQICVTYNEKAQANGQQQVAEATSAQAIQRNACAIIKSWHGA